MPGFKMRYFEGSMDIKKFLLMVFCCSFLIPNSVLLCGVNRKGLRSSSIWREFAGGATLSIKEKIDIFVKDCIKYQNYFQVPQKSSDFLRMVTYNIHGLRDVYAYRDPNAVIFLKDMIRNLDSDVLLLQEVPGLDGSSYFKNLKEALEDLEYNFLVVRVADFFDGFGNMLCVKKTYALSNGVEKIFTTDADKDEKRGFVGSHVSWHGKKIAVYTFHLDVFDNSEKTRENEVGELIAFVRNEYKKNPDITYIIGGDLNAVRKQDYDYVVSGKKVWDLLVMDDLLRNIVTPQGVEQLLEKEKDWLANVYDVLPDMAPAFTSCFGKVVDHIYYLSGMGLEPVGVYVDFTCVFTDLLNQIARAGNSLKVPSDHLPIVVDFKIVKTEVDKSSESIELLARALISIA